MTTSCALAGLKPTSSPISCRPIRGQGLPETQPEPRTGFSDSCRYYSIPGRFPTRHLPTSDISLPRHFPTKTFPYSDISLLQTFPYQDFSLLQTFPYQDISLPRHFPTSDVSLPRLFPTSDISLPRLFPTTSLFFGLINTFTLPPPQKLITSYLNSPL